MSPGRGPVPPIGCRSGRCARSLPLAALTIFAGTAATAAGPHAGGSSGQRIHRLTFKGKDTLMWVVHRHATIAAIFGVAVIGVWLLCRRRRLRRGPDRAADRARGAARRPGPGGQRPVRAQAPLGHGVGARRAGHGHVAGRAVGGGGCRQPCSRGAPTSPTPSRRWRPSGSWKPSGVFSDSRFSGGTVRAESAGPQRNSLHALYDRRRSCRLNVKTTLRRRRLRGEPMPRWASSSSTTNPTCARC